MYIGGPRLKGLLWTREPAWTGSARNVSTQKPYQAPERDTLKLQEGPEWRATEATTKAELVRHNGCFCKFQVLFGGVLITGALLFGVYTGAPDPLTMCYKASVLAASAAATCSMSALQASEAVPLANTGTN